MEIFIVVLLIVFGFIWYKFILNIDLIVGMFWEDLLKLDKFFCKRKKGYFWSDKIEICIKVII